MVLTIVEGYPAGFNDAAVTRLAIDAVREALGEDALQNPPIEPITGGEDFAYMSRQVPGIFIWLGVKNPVWPEPFHLHTPTFQIDERSLLVGTSALVATATEYLRRQA